MSQRQCTNCGRFLPVELTRCPDCREPVFRVAELPRRVQGKPEIRRGLLYMLLAATVYYFAAGHSSLPLPFHVMGVVTDYLLPLLFLSGMALSLYGAYRRITS